MRRSIIVLLALILLSGLTVFAQDAPPEVTPEVPVADAATETPIPQPTEAPPTLPAESTEEVLPTVEPTATSSPESTVEPLPESTEVSTEPVQPAIAPHILLPQDSLQVSPGQALTFAIRVTDDAPGLQISLQALNGGSVTWDVQTLASEADLLVNASYQAGANPLTDTIRVQVVDAEGLLTEANLSIIVAASDPTITPNMLERIINYDINASESTISAMLRALGAEEISRLPQIGAMLVRVPEFSATLSGARASMSAQASTLSSVILNVEPMQLRSISMIPNDPDYSLQWGLQDGAGGAEVEEAWGIAANKGTGVTVAVLDTGIDIQHPDFVGQLVSGWDFVNDDNNADDDQYHGTHVAGVIAARTNNLVGMAGIAYTAKLMPVKVMDSGGSGSTYDIAAGIIFAVDRGARVINMSLGGCCYSTTEAAAIQYALSRNVVVVAAAGNNGNTAYSYPASYDGVISVAAHKINGDIASFSTHNDRVTLSAPGVDIYSTFPIEQGSYASIDGTSMATPHVAGVVALIMANNVATTPAGVREALICSAKDAGDPGYDTYFGHGRLQADFALNWNGNSGDCKVVQPNDRFETATRITAVPFSASQAVDTRSVTTHTSDPVVCSISALQTLWYVFTPTVSNHYQITTYGSSYDTIVGVYQGQTGALREITCNNDFGAIGAKHEDQSHLAVPMLAGQTYYIMVGAGATADDQVLKLDVRPALSAMSVLQQESATFIQSIGWQRSTLTIANGGSIMETGSDDAIVAFVMRGSQLDLTRIVGPDQGEIDVYVDGGYVKLVSGRAALRRSSTEAIPMPGLDGTWHRVVLIRRPNSTGKAGNISIDALTARDSVVRTAITSTADDRDTRIFYSSGGGWSQATVAGTFMNTVTSTTTLNAYLQARVTGNTIVISRSTAPGFGEMEVYINGILYATVSNESGTGNSVPYVITGLNPVEHVLRVVLIGSQMSIDSIRGQNTAVTGNAKTDNAATSIVYSGSWTRVTNALTFSSSVHTTSDPTAAATVFMRANRVCVGYSEIPGGGSLQIWLDGSLYHSIATASAITAHQRQWCSSVFANDLHRVEIKASGGPIEFDFIHPQVYNTLTPARGVVQETDTAFIYEGVWSTVTGFKSAGGFLGQGSTLRTTTLINSNVSFYINGTGLILYTSVGPLTGLWQVYVDGVLQNITVSDTSYTYIDLFDSRVRPYAYALLDLPPGIHKIELWAYINPGSGFNYLDFDAVRVFP